MTSFDADADKKYLTDLDRMHRRAKLTIYNAGSMGSWLLDTYGPVEARGRFAFMGGFLCFLVMFFIGLLLDLGGAQIVAWCLLVGLVGGILVALFCPYRTFEQYLAAPLTKCSYDQRLIPLHEMIARNDLELDDKVFMVLEWTKIEINKIEYKKSN